MKLLLDTCTFLWIAAGDSALSKRARGAFEDPGNDVFLSVVSAWEIAVKCGLGRLPLPEPVDLFVPRVRAAHRIESLPLDEDSALALARLPRLHRDPFDRMLVCQAIQSGSALVTPDEAVRRYPVRTLW